MTTMPFPSRPARPAARVQATFTLALALALASGLVAAPAGAQAAPTIAQRSSAASATAANAAACRTVQPFYWSVGDATGRRASGGAGAHNPYDAGTVMPIASASKWVYGAYVAQKRGGVLSAQDVASLTFTSGYLDFADCQPGQTVGQCASWNGNDHHTPRQDGHFYYGGGHMQAHAVLPTMALGPDSALQLARAVNTALGTGFVYASAQPAGGIVTTPATYEAFLASMLATTSKLKPLLGSSSVCTNPWLCAQASYSPLAVTPTPLVNAHFRYSLGHWVESDPDPALGDGAFSSAGAFGFYPWIDSGKAWWGVLARYSDSGVRDAAGNPDETPAADSMLCGHQIRQAWLTGQAQP